MKETQFKVQCFHKKAGSTISKYPLIPSESDIELRLKLIREELEELDTAFSQHNLVEVADALGDLLYVVLGTAVTCGLEMTPIFNAIHKSNMSKFIDGYRRADGKWIKGPSYSPVNLQPIIENQLLGL